MPKPKFHPSERYIFVVKRKTTQHMAGAPYDTYISFVCIARDSHHAQTMHPNGKSLWSSINEKWIGGTKYSNVDNEWCRPEDTACVCIGKALSNAKSGVVHTNFNAG